MSEKREAAAQASDQADNTFLRVWTSRETEQQDTAEYLGCGCSLQSL